MVGRRELLLIEPRAVGRLLCLDHPRVRANLLLSSLHHLGDSADRAALQLLNDSAAPAPTLGVISG
jgi:hypothetical protein